VPNERRLFKRNLNELMTAMRQKRLQLAFSRPFSVKGINRLLPPGIYELVPDHELISEACFPLYRPAVALLAIPSQAYRRSSLVKANVDSAEILASHRRDQHGG
jgi:hypothetical protein